MANNKMKSYVYKNKYIRLQDDNVAMKVNIYNLINIFKKI